MVIIDATKWCFDEWKSIIANQSNISDEEHSLSSAGQIVNIFALTGLYFVTLYGVRIRLISVDFEPFQMAEPTIQQCT